MEERKLRNDELTERMPFLYNLLCAKLQRKQAVPKAKAPAPANQKIDPVEELSDEEDAADPSDDMPDFDGSVLKKSRDPATRRANRVQTISCTICAMVAFGENRRSNGFQLSNPLIFLAAGVTERVSGYLNFIGISSSRRTAHAALESLGREAETKLKARFELEKSPLIAPLLCYDNLDFQEKVHMKSIGHTSQMFHGTWGYVHSIPPSIVSNLNPDELTVEAMNQALHASKELVIRPDMFAPTRESTGHFKKTLKSQITWVILRYIANPTDTQVPLQKNPPEVNPIAPDNPNISMLKLMLASDNSAIGVGEVFTGVIQQSGRNTEQFHSRLQIIKGDLGSCNIFDSLRKQRMPALGDHNSLDNVLTIPGAAHTLWNLSQAIFLGHWGNEKHNRDTGAWRTLHALGIPTEKPVTKKDFNLMLSHVEKFHEVTLLYCVLETIHDWTELTYERFCSEANRAMKDGDYVRLMFMWQQWAVMSQGIGGMPHYSKHLPKLIILLKYILPQSLSHLVLNTLLMSPTGKLGHFVATDFYLEVQN
ncbi:hypothetical protein PTTG_04083 [Puccinia triticina 1-1 BBBD Race 1]|uniref:DUF6589 domain-containing protein n=1 Tax=Puccinia triticina (isolate 1-1 / race 1 (BBBD)) TaxID=630390 RepID=A0A0C4ETF4_PUCT1|nr:hypothetical protein PTTG_04083 [Puccinia triticina 1-1 BBBD Race 1]